MGAAAAMSDLTWHEQLSDVILKQTHVCEDVTYTDVLQNTTGRKRSKQIITKSFHWH